MKGEFQKFRSLDAKVDNQFKKDKRDMQKIYANIDWVWGGRSNAVSGRGGNNKTKHSGD